MEENKYYTPDISELHVGFEIELKLYDLIDWEKHTFLPRESLEGLQTYLDKKLILFC